MYRHIFKQVNTCKCFLAFALKKSCHHQYVINLGIVWATKDPFTISFIARETINAAFKEAYKMEKSSSHHCDVVAFGMQPSKDATPQLGHS